MREFRSARIFVALILLATIGSMAREASASIPIAEELVRQEQLRSALEDALALYHGPAETGVEENDNFVRAVDSLVRIGPEIVPTLVAELEQAVSSSYFLCAYALGRLGGPEAESALRRAIERADSEAGDYPLTRKGWAVYALGLMGVGDAVGLLYEGRHRKGGLAMHGGVNVLEATALHTQPECVPVLLELVDRLAGDPELRVERIKVLKALWRIAHPAAVPKLIEVIEEDDLHVRLAAVKALAHTRTPEALQATLAALDHPEPLVRRLAAISLERAQAEFPAEVVTKRLEAEKDERVRSALIVLLVQKLGAPAIDWMMGRWEQAPASERVAMLSALEELPIPESMLVLERALRDRDTLVVTRAVRALGTLGSREAVKRLRLAVHAPSWSAVRAAVEQLVKLGETAAGETVAERLLKVELYRVVRQADQRYRPMILADAVVSLVHTKALEGLKRATEKQVDPVLIESLRRNIAQLEALKANGDKLERWIEALRSPRREIRLVAYRRLAALGGDEAAKALVGAFGRVETDEGLEILRAAGEMSEEPILALLDRVLTTPEFDAVERWVLRDMAAWSARRIGGERMLASLREAVERRDARDARVLVYFLLLGGERALPTFEQHRLPRMRYMSWTRGMEWDYLDWIAHRIEAGRSLARFEIPPEEMDYR